VRPFIIRRARLALCSFGLFLCCLVGLADSGRGRWLFGMAESIPGGDKIGHFVLFGLLAFLVNLVLQATVVRCGRLTILKGSALVMVIVIAEEVSQLLFVSRSFEVLDLAADLAGIWFFGQLAGLYSKRERVVALQSIATARPNPSE
jgi:polysaccharide biosynthesis protein VpsQ